MLRVRSGLTEDLFRGRTQVEAGSRTVLGIGPGKSLVVSGEDILIILHLPRSTSKVGQPSDGTSPVTLDASYKILIHIHLGDLTTRTRYYSTSQVHTRPPLTVPAIHVQARKREHTAFGSIINITQRAPYHNLFLFIVLERLNAAEMSVT